MIARGGSGGRAWRAGVLAAALPALAPGCCRPASDGTLLRDGPFLAVSADRSATCAVERSGDVACWGESTLTRSSKPPAGPFAAIAASESCAVGLRPTGQLDGWGASCASPPPGRFVAVAAQHEGCAIRDDGDLVCWGLQGGVYQPPSGSPVPLPPSPPKITPGPFTRVSLGGGHGCAVRASGAIHCWGACAWRDGKASGCPARLPPPAGVWTEIASGDDYSCALSDRGEITCWGGPFGPTTAAGPASGGAAGAFAPAPPGRGFRSLSARQGVACAIDGRQQIQCWGRPVRWNATTYSPPAGPFARLSVGGAHVCGLRLDGKLACWGVDQQGQVTGRAPWPRT